MKVVKVEIEGVSPYSQSKYHHVPKYDKELNNDYELRTWRERMHYDEKTRVVFIPPMQLANSIKEAAKYLSIPVPGKGKTLFTKHFASGIMVTEPCSLGIKIDDVQPEACHVPSDGRRGGTTRVLKYFGIIRDWKVQVTYYVLDNIITKNVFEKVLRESGQLIGIGRFRPANWGYYGRFKVNSIEWIEESR